METQALIMFAVIGIVAGWIASMAGSCSPLWVSISASAICSRSKL